MTKRRIFSVFIFILCLGAWFLFSMVAKQGLEADEYKEYSGARISFDEDQVPTIEDDSWFEILKAQGFVTASERMFQMDLARRYAFGRLSELFGQKALPTDITQRKQDWKTTAESAYEEMIAQERKLCDAYAEGVNQFLQSFPDRVGIEFKILRYSPDKWTCVDSIGVLLLMAKRLSSSMFKDLENREWVDFLDEDWVEFLFPKQHPWNKPIFGEAFMVDSWPEALPATPIKEDEPFDDIVGTLDFYGSNSWVYVHNDKKFLANDPHLGHSVPQIWYSIRFWKAENDWVVGTSIPGIPGIVIGMNSHFAWGMTNIGEDVDSPFVEEIDFDQKKYVHNIKEGQKIWSALESRAFEIVVRGEENKKGTAYFTKRGPVLENEQRKGEFVSRQWLPLKPGVVQIPTLRMNRSRGWEDFTKAVDAFGTPGQNIVYLDRVGRIGYRSSGRTINRSKPSVYLESIKNPSWAGILPADRRLRKLIDFNPKEKNFLATANQRIWTDENRHAWAPDDRVRRINEVLEASDDASAEEMRNLFVDTHSLMHLKLRDFLLRFAGDDLFASGQKEEWLSWNGLAEEGKEVFTDLDIALRVFENVLVGRVKNHFAGKEKTVPKYYHYTKRAWIVRLLDNPDQISRFGLSANDLARHMIRKVNQKSRSNRKRYDLANAWAAQHPFVGNVPVIGDFFKVSEVPQTGFRSVVKVEAPKFGASMRLLFDLEDIHKSQWAFPVGQSGHFHRTSYTNFRNRFMKNKFSPMIPESLRDKFK